MTAPTTECPTCRTNGRGGYCAPKRCYCGHPECPAYTHDPHWTRDATNADHE